MKVCPVLLNAPRKVFYDRAMADLMAKSPKYKREILMMPNYQMPVTKIKISKPIDSFSRSTEIDKVAKSN